MQRIVLGLTLLLAACTTNNITNVLSPDMAAPEGSDLSVQGCPPNTKQCVDDTLARICPADGVSWLALPCEFGTVCQNGACVVDQATQPCDDSDNTCVSATQFLDCNSNGMGFTMKTCPASTTCSEGQCAGSCVVGSSLCLDINTVSVCNNGLTFTSTKCAAGETCAGGACQAATCQPGSCALVCGNKAVSGTSTDPGFISSCDVTALGHRWVTIACPSGKTCDPTIACAGNDDPCVSECTAGAVRCNANGTGTQTCGANGKWGNVTLCNGAASKVCVTDANGQVLGCGDTICRNGGKGGCVQDGGISKLRACDATGNLAPANMLTTCAIGVCAAVSNQVDNGSGLFPGQCSPECLPDDSRCVISPGGASLQSCTAQGRWSVQTEQCEQDGGTNVVCREYEHLESGRIRAICGECAPGQTRCATAQLETCGADGHWGAPQTCVASHCVAGACVADCLPGKKVCAGAAAGGTAPVSFGTTQESTCTADGRIGAPAACTAGTSCRKDKAGNAHGCVTCVGGQNEAGQTDTRCQPGNPVVEVCNPDSSGWGNPTTCMNGLVCFAPQSPTAGPTCGACSVFDPGDANPCTPGNIDAVFPIGLDCSSISAGAPMSCGATPDCCSNFCTIPPDPLPARCGSL
jgi:hypothetical protein